MVCRFAEVLIGVLPGCCRCLVLLVWCGLLRGAGCGTIELVGVLFGFGGGAAFAG